MSNELNYNLKAIELIKDGRFEEKIMPIRKQEFGFTEKEVLDNLRKVSREMCLRKFVKTVNVRIVC